MTYLFDPPTVRVPLGDSLSGDPVSRFFSRVGYDEGQAVYRLPDGTFHSTPVVDWGALPEGSTVWGGGQVHEVSDAEAAELTAAGYGLFLTPEGE